MEKEEVERHRSPLESNPGTQEDQDENAPPLEEIDEEEVAKQLEAIDKAAGNTALNEVIAKVKAKAKLEVNDIPARPGPPRRASRRIGRRVL
jgi:hypothetical protein